MYATAFALSFYAVNSLDGFGILLEPKHKEMITFQKRIIKYRDHVFTFLYHPDVPPDNNGSERAIRNVKVKKKYPDSSKYIMLLKTLPS